MVSSIDTSQLEYYATYQVVHLSLAGVPSSTSEWWLSKVWGSTDEIGCTVLDRFSSSVVEKSCVFTNPAASRVQFRSSGSYSADHYYRQDVIHSNRLHRIESVLV
jgi:hypothetical protein